MFAFTPSVFKHFEESFQNFIKENRNDMKAEFFMPSVIDNLINSNKATVEVLETSANWFGLTYSEDKPIAREKILKLIEQGIYPSNLWT
jgi:hypothetical protein